MKERGVELPVPTDVTLFLTPEQQGTIRTLESYGWELWFIRRPLFQETTTVMRYGSDKRALIEVDGNIVINPDIIYRN